MTSALTEHDVAEFRARLTRIATQVFNKEGIGALSLRNLAGAAGVSRSTPYSYFRSKEEIIDSIRASGVDRLRERSEDLLRSASNPLSRMRALAWALLTFAKAEPRVYELVFSRPVFEGEVPEALRDALARYREVSRPPLEEAIAEALVCGDVATIRRTTWAAFHGLISLYLSGHFESEQQLLSDFEELNRMLGHGILTPAGRQLARVLEEQQGGTK